MAAAFRTSPESGSTGNRCRAGTRPTTSASSTLFLRDPQDAVVSVAHPAPPVAVARRDVEGAVGTEHRLPQPPVVPVQEVLGGRHLRGVRAIETHAHELL